MEDAQKSPDTPQKGQEFKDRLCFNEYLSAAQDDHTLPVVGSKPERREQVLRKVRLQRCKAKRTTGIMTNDEPHSPVTEWTDPVIQHNSCAHFNRIVRTFAKVHTRHGKAPKGFLRNLRVVAFSFSHKELIMKIIAIADIHGGLSKVDAILAKERPFDAIIIAGDLTTLGSPDEAQGAIQHLNQHDTPIAVVAGNMDPPELETIFAPVSVNATGVVWGEVGVFGVSGSPPTPMDTPYEISEEEILRRVEDGWRTVQACRWKILVSHAPPHDTPLDIIARGRHVGSRSIRSFIERRHPDLVVSGHIHEARGIDAIGSTTIVNCGTASHGLYAVITIDSSLHVELRG